MGIIQKRFIKPKTLLYLTVPLALLAVIVSNLSLTQPVLARDGCTDTATVQSFPGAGTNAGKCVRNVTVRGVTTQVATGEVVATASPTPTASPPAKNAADSTANDDNTTTCAVEKIGWILCPIMEEAAKISDKAFQILADNFLQTDPELTNDKAGTKIAWEVARNIANIMFIIAFLIIIISQVTGQGLSNYGIKKMLPRLIIAAIAVNVSYYICQLAVDITNIFGYEIQNMMAQIANTVGPSVFGKAGNFSNTEIANTQVFDDGALLTLIITAGLAAGAIVYFLLPTMVALVPLILITVSTVIVILLLRKALIVLLIVLSPIAFVMYLLPNTEKYYSKWMGMFGKLLMVFPIVSLLFGAGQLASTIILVSGSSSSQTTATQCDPNDATAKKAYDNNKKAGDPSCGEPSVSIQGGKDGNNTCFAGSSTCGANKIVNTNISLGLVAMGVAVAPLLAVWSVLQGALSAAGAIGGRLTSAVSKGMSKSVSGGTSATKKVYEGSDFGRGRALRMEGKKAEKNERFLRRLGTNRASRLAAGGLSGITQGLPGSTGAAQQQRLDRAAALGASLETKRESEDVQNRQAQLSHDSHGNMEHIAEELEQAIRHGDEVGAKAAQNLLMGMGGAGIDRFAQAVIEAEADNTSDARTLRELKVNTSHHHGNIKEKSGDLNRWMSNDETLTRASANTGSFSGLSDAQIAGQTHAALHAAIESGALNQGDAQRVLGNTNVTANLGGTQRRMLESLSRGDPNNVVANTFTPAVDQTTGRTTRRV